MEGRTQLRAHRVIYLISGYVKHSLNEAEQAELEQWRLEQPANELFFQQLADEGFRNSELADWKVEETEQVLQKLQAGQALAVVPLWRKIAVAAAAVAAVTLGTWLYYASSINDPSTRVTEGPLAYASDIAPGSVGATLTLANGKTIKLSDATNGELAKEAGITITKTADGQLIYDLSSSQGSSSSSRGTEGSLDPATSRDPSGVGMTGSVGMTKGPGATNTLSTAKGETYQVRLPDGSKVWLNAASSITYSAALSERGARRVSLEGEAYFEIFKSKTQKFVVVSKKQEVEVLGTHFNISSYADEPAIKTTLLEGSVRVSSSLTSSSSRGKRSDEGSLAQANSRGSSVPRNDGGAVILKPNQQSVFSNNQLSIKNVDAAEAVAWKDGEFLFNKEALGSIMKKVSRWYNVEIYYEDRDIENKAFWGSISRFSNVSDVLKMLELTGDVHFKIEGRKIIVKR